MGNEITKTPEEIKSAEARNFGTGLNSQEMNSRVFSDEILSQKNSKFTDFLSYECISCKSSLGIEKAIAVDDGWACADCFEGLADKTVEVLKSLINKPKR